MEINLTLLGQAITFLLFALFTMKFVWPLLEQSIEERQKNISDGIAAGEKGRAALDKAKSEEAKIIKSARVKSDEIIEHAKLQAQVVVDNAKSRAIKERDEILASGRHTLNQEVLEAKHDLTKELARYSIDIAEKIIKEKLDSSSHEKLIMDSLSEFKLDKRPN